MKTRRYKKGGSRRAKSEPSHRRSTNKKSSERRRSEGDKNKALKKKELEEKEVKKLKKEVLKELKELKKNGHKDIRVLISKLEDEKNRLEELDSITTNKIEQFINDTDSLLKGDYETIQTYKKYKNKMITFLTDTKDDIDYLIEIEYGNKEKIEKLFTGLAELTKRKDRKFSEISKDFRESALK